MYVRQSASDYFVVLPRNCLSSTLDYIVMLMRKTNRKIGYLKLSHISLGEVTVLNIYQFILERLSQTIDPKMVRYFYKRMLE